MPLLSIVTAAWAPTAAHLGAVYEGLKAQRGLGDWDWEWVIQEDDGVSLGREFSAHARVRYDGKALRAGIAGTRNLALTKVGLCNLRRCARL
ncbi:MAG: hypothetical protein ABI629_21340, partial [bacterium]